MSSRINNYEKVTYEGEEVTIIDTVMVPNGADDSKLVCLIYARKENGNVVSATSDKFFASCNIKYQEFYPTVHLNKISDKYRMPKIQLKSAGWAILFTLISITIGSLVQSSSDHNLWGVIGWLTGLIYSFTYFGFIELYKAR